MCGLAGFVCPERRFSERFLSQIETDLHHRGPDSGGSVAEPGWALVFRRLAIMDPHAQSDQPMTDETGDVTLTFNGEIYNFLHLKADLQAKGVQFRTKGDSEVILRGYIQWGEAVFEKLEGMFAVLLVDRRRNKLIAVRDPMGIKPLYRTRKNGVTAIASEMRPLFHITPPKADPAAFGELLAFSWAAGTLSNVQGIERVPGGTILSIDLATGEEAARRYCDPIDTIASDLPAATTEEADAALEQSLTDHLMSDVGYSLQLSGGIDSSYVAARTRFHQSGDQASLASFGVKIPGYEHDEGDYRKMVVDRFKLDHTETALDGEAFSDALPRAIAHMEGPVPHGGCVMLMLLCATIREQGFKVVLTGEGADEFFGGYHRYGDWKRLFWREKLAALPFTGLLPNVPPFIGLKRFAGLDMAAYSALYHKLEPLQAIFPDHVPPAPGDREKQSSKFADFRDRLLAVDQSAYLESLLVRQDKMSMAESIEARVPFVHWPLAQVLNRLPRNARIPGGETKPILKSLAARYLPHDLIYRRKIGLWLPYDKWLQDDTKLGRYLDEVASPNSKLSEFGDAKKLAHAVDSFRRGAVNGPRMWSLVNQELWLRSLIPPAASITSPFV